MKEMEIPQKFYNYGDKIANKYYYSYPNYFNAISLDSKDLCQETKLAIFTTAKKFGVEGLSIPLVNKSVIWRLNQLKYLGIREIQKENITLENNYTSEDKTFFEFTSFDELADLIDLGLEEKNKQDEAMLDWEMIAETLTEKEYKIIYSYFKNSKTFKEIATEMKMTKQGVHLKYKTALKKLRKILDKY